MRDAGLATSGSPGVKAARVLTQGLILVLPMPEAPFAEQAHSLAKGLRRAEEEAFPCTDCYMRLCLETFDGS